MEPRIKARLTSKFVSGLASPKSGYVIAWDMDLKGFGCRVTAAGIKSFPKLQRKAMRSPLWSCSNLCYRNFRWWMNPADPSPFQR